MCSEFRQVFDKIGAYRAISVLDLKTPPFSFRMTRPQVSTRLVATKNRLVCGKLISRQRGKGEGGRGKGEGGRGKGEGGRGKEERFKHGRFQTKSNAVTYCNLFSFLCF